MSIIIPEWRKALRSYSAMALAFVALIPALWAEMPPEVIAMIPDEWHKWIIVTVAAAGFVGRFISQGGKDADL